MSQTSLPSSAIKLQVAARFTYVEPDKVLQRLTCPVCLEPFVEPRRTPCKHTFCEGCIKFIAAQPNGACPTCRVPLSNAKLETADETLLEFLGELVVYCPNKARQCEWKGPRANLKEHLERTCERVSCRYSSRACNILGKASVVQKHELECEYGDAPCALKCGYVGQRRLHSEHQANCPVHIKQQEEARKKAEEEARKRREQAEAEEKRDRELQQLYDSLNPAAENVLHLNVGGQHFQTSRGVLCREPQSVLAGLFTTKRPLQRDNAGVVFLDLDPVAFEHILAWLRTGVVPRNLDPDQKAVVLDTAKQLRLVKLAALLAAVESQLQQGRHMETVVDTKAWDQESAQKKRVLELLEQGYRLGSTDVTQDPGGSLRAILYHMVK